MSRARRVLIIDDEKNFADVLGNEVARMGYATTVVNDPEEALERAANEEFDLALLDIKMPGIDGIEVLRRLRELDAPPETIMLTGHATVDTALRAMKTGAYDYLTKPCKLEELDLLLGKAIEKREAVRDRVALRRYLGEVPPGQEIIGRSTAIESLLEKLDKVAAASDVPVLITGESGTGKELVARELHRRGPLHAEPFVALNCAVLQSSVIESELFGHEKGSFTGATARKEGLFEVADGGTLFLDEIGEIDEGIQAKLLRTIQFGTFRRVGGTEERTSKVRVIAATNRDLPADIEEGRFREDLYYRLNVVTLDVPPLRERPDDIPLLAQFFLERFGGRTDEPPVLDEAAREALAAHSWPGNVRELENCVRRLLIFRSAPTIGVVDVREALGIGRGGSEASIDLALADVERAHILKVLRLSGGNKTHAAEKLGIAPKTLYNKLNAFRDQGFEV